MDLQLVERAKMILGLSNATNKVALLTTDDVVWPQSNSLFLQVFYASQY